MDSTADTNAATAMALRPAYIVAVDLLALLLVNPPPPLFAIPLVLVLIVLVLVLFVLFFILLVHKDTTPVADDDLPTALGEVVPGQGTSIKGTLHNLGGGMQLYGQRGDQYC